MARFLKKSLIVLFLILIPVGSLTMHAIVQGRSYGKLINYAGIVRGATQRLVKLELQEIPNDELIIYLDGILSEMTGSGTKYYGLIKLDDKDYQERLSELNDSWNILKKDIISYRNGKDDGNKLLENSEIYFEKANNTVFAAEHYYEQENRRLFIIGAVLLFLMLITWTVIFMAYGKKVLLLEDKNKELSDLAYKDNLTGAYKIDFFKEKAQALIDSEPGIKFAIAYTDFDNFKYINDVFGYEYGDMVLKKYSQIISDQLQDKELFGRVSADNFVLLVRYNSRDELILRQKMADEKITNYMNNSIYQQSLPTCCGFCCIEDVIEDLKIEGLLDRANFARMTVKKGDNRNYAFYDEGIRNRLREEKDIERKMYSALENEWFVVYYQPKVDLKTGRPGGCEALVRMRGENGEIISPGKFIPVYEKKMMINQLDRLVFEKVCIQLRKLIDEGKKPLPVSVNVSRLQFYEIDFVEKYVGIRDKYAIPEGLLEIEVTESIVFNNTGRLIEIVKSLKNAGFLCSIDDFGSGYSSLSLIKILPIDVLKIDRIFFIDSENQQKDRAVVESIIEMVKKFNIRTVAEGIEDMEQVEFLKSIGCDYIQGYVFYKPMPFSEYEKLLENKAMSGAAQM